MTFTFYHTFKPGPHGPGGVSESNLVICTPAEWEADPRSKSGKWSAVRTGRRKPRVIALAVMLPTPDIDIPPPRRRWRREAE